MLQHGDKGARRDKLGLEVLYLDRRHNRVGVERRLWPAPVARSSTAPQR